MDGAPLVRMNETEVEKLMLGNVRYGDPLDAKQILFRGKENEEDLKDLKRCCLDHEEWM